MKRSLIVAFGCLVLAGCISTQEMPLAPNMVRLDTQSRGLLFTGQTVPQTMRTAALATVNRGYTRYRRSRKLQWLLWRHLRRRFLLGKLERICNWVGLESPNCLSSRSGHHVPCR